MFMTYTIYYKHKDQLFWRKLKNIKGDGIMPDWPYPVRFFIADDEARYEIPIVDTIFKFSKERFIVVKQNMEKESGQKLNISK
jgi:hypothetical protein